MMRTGLPILLLMLIASSTLAEVYKSLGPNGQIVYSSQSSKNSTLLSSNPSKSSFNIYRRIAANGSVYYTDTPDKSFNWAVIRTKPRTYQHDLKFLSANKSKFDDLIAKAAAKHQIDPKLLHAVIQAESAYNPIAVSTAGAVGLMQLMPDTARRYGVVDRRDAEQNIDGGTRYLKDLMGMFNSNLRLAVAGYNAGEGAVMKYNNTVPPYPETQNYVQQVMRLYGKS